MTTEPKHWHLGLSGHEPPAPRRSLASRLVGGIRHGGSWFVRWPLRILVLAGVVAAGFLPYKHEVGGPCRIVTPHEVALRAQLQDEISEIHVAAGDTIAPGQTVASLSAREERARLAEAQADLAYAEANLKQIETGPREEEIAKAVEMVAMWKTQIEYLEKEHKRHEGLVASQAGPVNAMEKALSDLNNARSMLISAREEERKLQAGHREETVAAAQTRVDKAKATLQLQQERMGLCDIRSSLAGTISTPGVKLRVGQTVSPGDVIAVVRDMSKLEVEVLADEAAAEVVEPGQPVKIRLWGRYGELVTGRVERVDFVASDKAQLLIEPFRSDRENRQEQMRFPESDTRYVKLAVAFDQLDPKMLPGMSGEARVVVGDDYFWSALWRPIKRFFLVEVWSWLP